MMLNLHVQRCQLLLNGEQPTPEALASPLCFITTILFVHQLCNFAPLVARACPKPTAARQPKLEGKMECCGGEKAPGEAVEQQLSALPPELVEHLWSFLPLRDLLRVSLVCRDWQALAASPSFWRFVPASLLHYFPSSTFFHIDFAPPPPVVFASTPSVADMGWAGV